MKHWTVEDAVHVNELPDINEHRLMRQLRDMLARIEMPNRTPAAEAMHTALVADLRTAGRASDALNALTEEQIVFAYGDVAWALQSGNALSFELPFGTTAIQESRERCRLAFRPTCWTPADPGCT